MSYCFNPYCSQPENSPQQDICSGCGANLIWKERYRGIKLLGKSQLALTIEITEIDNNQSENKVLKILLTNYPKAVELFQQEACILGQMNHIGLPKIATEGYFSWQPQWSKNPVYCIVTEKIIGFDLEKWLQQRDNQPISEQQAQEWLKQLLEILAQLHQQQYFHRDIKPANIMLQPNGKLALIDFGAARKVTATYLGKVAVNQGVTSIGTPGYIAPEQIDGAALPQSDFFALGRTLVHLLTGKHPQELPKNLDTGAIIWRNLAPQVSASFADLLDRMMNIMPAKRPMDIAAIQNALIDLQKFPHKSPRKLHFSPSILLGAIFAPLAVVGLFSLADNLKQRVNANKITNTSLCNNLTCINRDPIDNKCDRDAQTITSDTGNYQVSSNLLKAYRLEMRFSPTCQATWIRSEAPPGSTHYVEDRQGTKYGTAVVPVDQWQEHYADMGPGKNIEIRACAEPTTGKKKCTNFIKL